MRRYDIGLPQGGCTDIHLKSGLCAYMYAHVCCVHACMCKELYICILDHTLCPSISLQSLQSLHVRFMFVSRSFHWLVRRVPQPGDSARTSECSVPGPCPTHDDETMNKILGNFRETKMKRITKQNESEKVWKSMKIWKSETNRTAMNCGRCSSVLTDFKLDMPRSM